MPKLKKGTIVPTDQEDAAITAAAEADPDNPPLSDEMLERMRPVRGRPKLEHPKENISMRLDADLLKRLRAEEGWQTRVNAILRREVLGER